MPEADEAFVRAHREDLLALAAGMGITDVKVASTGRLVGTVTVDDLMMTTAIDPASPSCG
jgi:hypothetical protein